MPLPRTSLNRATGETLGPEGDSKPYSLAWELQIDQLAPVHLLAGVAPRPTLERAAADLELLRSEAGSCHVYVARPDDKAPMTLFPLRSRLCQSAEARTSSPEATRANATGPRTGLNTWRRSSWCRPIGFRVLSVPRPRFSAVVVRIPLGHP